MAAELQKRHARVVEVDRYVRTLLRPGEPAWHDLLEAFCGALLKGRRVALRPVFSPGDFNDRQGRAFTQLPWVIGPRGNIRRDRLGALVFSRPAALKRLNRIVQPRLRQLLDETVAQHRQRSRRPLVLDMAVYPEPSFRGLGDVVLWVRASQAVRAQRLAKRKRLSPAQARARVRAQWPDAAYRKISDCVLSNTGSNRDLRLAVEKIWSRLLTKAAGGNT